MGKKLEVKLTNQSFSDAGGLEVFPELEMGDIVVVLEKRIEGYTPAIESTYEKLKEKTKDQGFTHIFGVSHECNLDPDVHPGYNKYQCEAKGTGYKKI